MSIKSFFEPVGQTVDGKLSYKGVYRFHETHGIPLDILFDIFKRNNELISWIEFYQEARDAGMKHDHIISKLEPAISDVWGKDFCNVVLDKLNLIFSQEPEYVKRAKEIYDAKVL